MALLWFQGFDYLPTGVLPANISGSLGMSGANITIVAPGRFNAGNYCLGDMAQVVSGHVAHGFLGFATRVNAGIYTPQINFIDGASGIIQFRLEFCPFGVIRMWGKGDSYNNSMQLLATSDVNAYAAGPWNFYEIEIIVAANSGGTVNIRCNTTPVVSFASVATQSPACSNGFFTVVQFKNPWDLDDLYLCDASGAAPLNSWLGNVRCQSLLPNGAGSSSQFTPSDASKANWQCVLNNKMDDSLYVASAVTGNEDSYHLQPLVNSPQVLAVQTHLAARQDDATQRALASVLISGGTEVTGASINLSQTMAVQTDIFLSDPATGVSWLYPAVNQIKIGQRVTG